MPHLYRASEGWVTGGIGSAGVAAIAQFIDEVPGKDGRLILVLAPVESVGAVDNGCHVILVQLDDGRVSEEVTGGHGVAPLDVLEEAILEVPVVGEGEDEFDASFTGVVDDLVQALKRNLVVHTCPSLSFVEHIHLHMCRLAWLVRRTEHTKSKWFAKSASRPQGLPRPGSFVTTFKHVNQTLHRALNTQGEKS